MEGNDLMVDIQVALILIVFSLIGFILPLFWKD